MILKQISEDVRGRVWRLEGDFSHDILLFEFKKAGVPRGGHCHDKINDHIILEGKLLYKTKNIEKIVKSGDLVKTKPGEPHIFISKEKALFIEIKDKNIKTFDSEEREIVKKYLEENK